MNLTWPIFGAFVCALLLDHFVVWRAFEHSVAIDAAQARRAWRKRVALLLWACTAMVLALWSAHGWPPDLFGVPQGWRLWLPLALTAAAVATQLFGGRKIASASEEARAALQVQLGQSAHVLPRDTSEAPAWLGLSVTAGFCEELLFRGFVPWALQPVAGWWWAAAASLALFAVAHSYQGTSGVARSATIGAVMTLLAFLSKSLWPAVVLHAALDAMGGWIGWLILRDTGTRATSASESLAPR